MNIVFIIILSFLISFAWISYFRMIDVFENEKFISIATTFVIGTIIPFIIYPIHSFIYQPIGISDSDDPFLKFLFYTFAVGLLEECVKALPVIIILKLIKPAINEPLDYIKYACVSALGFAFGENVEYARIYGEAVLLSRSILSVPAHMFFSSIFIYGYVLYKYEARGLKFIFYYGMLGFLAHGVYDFLLSIDNGFLGISVTLLFFFLVISVFVNIVNNGINNSPFYTPKKSVDQEKVRSRLALYYMVIVLGIFICSGFSGHGRSLLGLIVQFLFRDFLVLFVLIVRLSRMSIIPALWRNIQMEFPMSYSKHKTNNDFSLLGMTIKGESYNDHQISLLFEEELLIIPMSSRKSYLSKTHKGIIEKKFHMNEVPVFTLKIYLDEEKTNFKHFLLITKKDGITHSQDKYPIVSLNVVKQEKNEILFQEWVILKKAA